MGGRGRVGLLLSTSVAALLIGGGAPAAFAQCYTGPFPFTNSGPQTCITVSGTSFSGNVVNSAAGVITPGSPNGILVTNASTITGQIFNAGTISVTAGTGIRVDTNSIITNGIVNQGLVQASGAAIVVDSVSTFGGGIINSGTITASGSGISVNLVGTFAGGITNIGALTAGAAGISITDSGTFSGPISNSGTISAGTGILVGCGCGVTFVSGGITNSGTIAATSAAIVVTNVATFAGGIVNSSSGSMSGAVGIVVSGVGVFGSAGAGSGIVNNGTIAAALGDGILVGGVGTFLGGITNSGTISAPFGNGILVAGVNTFAGSIANSGSIAATSAAIVVAGVATFAGSIVNSSTGTLSGGVGIVVSGVGVFGSASGGGIVNQGFIQAATTGIVVNGVGSFQGGILNQGMISAGSAGIVVVNVSRFSGDIANQGSIEANIGILVGGATCGCGFLSTFIGNIVNSGTITADGASSQPGIGILVNNVELFSGGIDNEGTIVATPATIPGLFGGTGIAVSNVGTFTGDIRNGKTIVAGPTATGVGIRVATVDTFGGNIINAGTITAGFAGIQVDGAASFGGGISNGGLISISQPFTSFGISVRNVSLFSGSVSNSGTISGANIGIEICGCVQTFLGGVTNSGTIQATGVGIVVSVDSSFGGHVVNTGTISVSPGGTAIDLTGSGAAITIDQNAGLIAGDISFSSHGDTLNIRGGTINGNILGQNIAGEAINFSLGAGTFTYAAAYGFTNINEVNVNSGVVILNGVNDAANVAINGGLLQVGDELSSGATLTSTVDVIGGTLSGHGTIAGDVTIENGGILFPGGSIGMLTITNNLTFNGPGGLYAVQITPTANSSTAVFGSASISNNTVVVIPQLGHYDAKTYQILTVGGATTGSFATTPTFAGPFAFTGTASVITSSNEADLVLTDGFALLAPTGTNQNQQAVVNGINAFILGTGNTPPPQFANLANLPGPALLNALSQLSGENHAGFLQGAFQAGNTFLSLLVNPFLDGRFGPGGGFAAAMGFAPEEPPAMPEAALAFAKAMPTKAPPLGIATRASAAYRVWGSAYGGTETVDGNAAVGSQRTTSRAFGFAAGIDYPIAPMTTVGFALAGGGTSWGLDGGLGGGHSDMFQAGAYGSHRWGAAYLSGALSYNFHDVTTDRTVTVAGVDRLTAGFQANGIGARLEGGYRYATPWLGITPYAAAQVQSIFLPGYGESATAGSNQFALNFASQTATATRTELGAWLDRSTLLANGALVTLYGRAAWAHDFGNTRAVSAIFQGLPGSNFVVNGAAPAPDSALVTAGALYRLTNGWSFQAKFDGEFSSTTNVYSGTGVVKKVW